ncbi:protein of unknown function [Maridesulfovibrio hydrothermalis AM13 = DSM 14728]|uniref:Uncharacterized protein n=1 Tax=Maridesulfovibrio hydrothermalis AM13 = DSM 14728 TaxID=1121451 RepID=L0RFI0_9BACT|nr:protein of unknown function [Maridesulfovibrio hydrothermalis AM13 = DSM 14728]
MQALTLYIERMYGTILVCGKNMQAAFFLLANSMIIKFQTAFKSMEPGDIFK